MRCTFYVYGEVFDPWVEELPTVPVPDHQVSRQGTQWTVTQTWLSGLPGSGLTEASVVLALATDEAVTSRRPRRRRVSRRITCR